MTDLAQAREMLAAATRDLPLSRAERALLAEAECRWLPEWVAALASLLACARAAGGAS